MEFSRQEYWSGLPFSSEDLPDPGKILNSGQILWPFSDLILQMAKMWHGRIKGFVFNINNDYTTNIIQWELNITLLITGLQFFSCQHSHINTYKHAHTPQTSTSDVLTMPKPLAVWITTNWKILKEMGIPDYLICLLKNLYAGQEETVRIGHGTIDWSQTSKSGNEYINTVHCHSAYLTYMQRT